MKDKCMAYKWKSAMKWLCKLNKIKFNTHDNVSSVKLLFQFTGNNPAKLILKGNFQLACMSKKSMAHGDFLHCLAFRVQRRPRLCHLVIKINLKNTDVINTIPSESQKCSLS